MGSEMCIRDRSNTNVLARQFVDHKRATEFASHKLGRPACSLSLPKGGWRLAILGLGDVAQPKPCRSPANGPRPTAQLATRDASRDHSSLVGSCWLTMCSCQEVRDQYARSSSSAGVGIARGRWACDSFKANGPCPTAQVATCYSWLDHNVVGRLVPAYDVSPRPARCNGVIRIQRPTCHVSS